jgi:hypothetical protein
MHTMQVLSTWPDGSSAAAVELELPQSELERELLPITDSTHDDLLSYNASTLMPLIPQANSWMSLAYQMDSSKGLDIKLAWRLSTFAAISYCDIKNLPTWNCSRLEEKLSLQHCGSCQPFKLVW